MSDQWQLLKEVKTGEHHRIEAQAFVPEDSCWFSGHFPGEPILPGVAIVHLVWQVIFQDASRKGRQVKLDTVKRVRFTQPVRPGQNLSIFIICGDDGEEDSYAFRVLCGENVVCSGLIAVSKIN